MSKKKRRAGNPAWVVGAYFKSIHDLTIYSSWGARIPGGIRIKKGSIVRCEESFIKEAGEDYQGLPLLFETPFVRLVAADPKASAIEERLVSVDQPAEFSPATYGFNEIKSPLLILALLEEGRLP